jgi:vacuolar-type H+-ATPase subunit F/Vma7
MNGPNLLVLGTPDDVRGFALAGVPGVTPAGARELEERLATPGLELIFVSPEVAALAPQALAAPGARGDGPLILLLPKGGADANAGERGGAVRSGA